MTPGPPVEIRPERADDVDEVSAVVAAAFSAAEHSAPPTRPGGPPGEVDLLAWLRDRPDRQRGGVGAALVGAVLARAEESGESLVALLGDLAYYRSFGFLPARELGIESPEPAWGDHFQARVVGDGGRHPAGRFAYAEPFSHF